MWSTSTCPRSRTPPRRTRAAAGEVWRRWLTEGVLAVDDEPGFTIYRMRFTDEHGDERDLAAVVGALEVVDEGPGRAGTRAHHAKGLHRPSRPDPRHRCQSVTGVGPVPGPRPHRVAAGSGEPVGRVDVEGVAHVVERVTDPVRVAAIADLVSSDEVLIADGHHRYGVARMFRDEVRSLTGRADGTAELTLAYVGELVPEQLSIRAIHRLYAGADHARLREALARCFELSDAPMPSLAMLGDLVDKGVLALIGPDGAAEFMTPRPGAFDDVRALDGAWLEHALADLPVEVDYQHGVAEVLEAVVSGRAHSAVLISPVSIAEIERTARERLLMPPKSTLHAQVRTGLVLRSLL